jgi:hypothetical protein
MEVKGFPNYKIYPDGRVWSKKRKGTDERFLRPNDNGNGYKCIGLHKDGKRKIKYIHRLVAEHYISNPESRPEVDHINRNRADNRVENLRWVSSKENRDNQSFPSNYKSNTSGHRNIYYRTENGRWKYSDRFINKTFKTKKEALCYKFIQRLKIKSNLI